MIKNIIGEGRVLDKKAVVICEKCNKERTVKYLTAMDKNNPLHICRSCSITETNTGTKRSELAKKNMSIAQRKIHNGGIRYNQGRGYKQLIVDEYHPRKKNRKGGSYIFEHVLVVEKQIGRFLNDHEIVHHIDGDKENNSPQNLFLCSGQDRKESNQIHNHAHDTAEKIVFNLYKKGLIKFENGEYKMSEELKNFVSKEQIISLNFDNLGIPNCSCHGIVRDNK
jgi:hypothetical protein